MNRVIEQIYRSGCVEDAHGNTYPHDASSVTLEAGDLLYDFVRTHKPAKTIEIGMAYGLSTLFIGQAHHDNGMGAHTVIDPMQHTLFKSIGLLNLERAGLKNLIRFYDARSDEALPELCARQEQFDFAWIDGSHLFDYVMVDFFFIDKLVGVGGYVAFDDLWMPGVRKAVSFVMKNKPYSLIPMQSKSSVPAWNRILRAGRRIVQNPLEPDWALKLIPQNIAVFRKVAEDAREWQFHRAF